MAQYEDSPTQSRFDILKNVLSLSHDELGLLVVYAIVIGFLTLVVPIAAQRLVTIVSFGTIVQPLFLLSFILFILLVFAGIISLLNTVLIESIQQRIFAVSALKITKRLVHVHLDKLGEYRGTELVNRFFDITSIQKNIGELLLNGTGLIIQSLLGLLLLAIYHPFLILFDLFFLLFLGLTLWLPWKKALHYALQESDAKYKLVAWLEEIVRLPTLFRFQNHENFAFKQADNMVESYLIARQSHFKALLFHISGTYVIQILASTSLLLIGGLLVMSNQMTLGQLVAAEIIVNSLGIAVTKFGFYLEKIYDLLASAEKVNILLQLKIDIGLHPDKAITADFIQPPQITVKNLVLPHSSASPLSFDLNPGEKAIILGEKGTGKGFLIHSLLGFNQQNQNKIYYNHYPLSEYNLNNLRASICFIKGVQLFDGTILDNLMLNKDNISHEKIRSLLLAFNLERLIEQLEKGLKTQLNGLQFQLSSIEKQKLMFVRAILSDPFLIVLDEALDSFGKKDLDLVLEQLLCPKQKSTLIATSRREEIGAYFSKKICL